MPGSVAQAGSTPPSGCCVHHMPFVPIDDSSKESTCREGRQLNTSEIWHMLCQELHYWEFLRWKENWTLQNTWVGVLALCDLNKECFSFSFAKVEIAIPIRQNPRAQKCLWEHFVNDRDNLTYLKRLLPPIAGPATKWQLEGIFWGWRSCSGLVCGGGYTTWSFFKKFI